MPEVVISKPSKTVSKSLRGHRGKIWEIVITTDDDMGITFQISKDNLKKHRVVERMARWAGKNWIRAGIVANKYMIANSQLQTELVKLRQNKSRHLDNNET